MINLLIISASPVEQSSTDLILKHAAGSFSNSLSGWFQVQAEFVKLNELKFIPCQSCGEAPTPKFCFYDDDLTDIYTKLERCDCLLFGSPVYFDSVSAQAKTFIDRCNCFRPPDFNDTDPDRHFIRRLKRKRPGAMVLVGGQRGWFEGARRVVAGFFKWIEVTNEGMIKYCSPDFTRSGSVSEDKETLAQADELGQKLAAIIKENYAGQRND